MSQRATLAGAINRAEVESVDERGKRRTVLGSRTSLCLIYFSLEMSSVSVVKEAAWSWLMFVVYEEEVYEQEVTK